MYHEIDRDYVFRTKIKSFNQELFENDPNLAETLLESLENLIFPRQVIKVSGFPDILPSDLSDKVEKMSPKIVFAKAQAWHILDTVQYFKKYADGFVRAKDADRAARCYRRMLKLLGSYAFIDFPRGAYNSDLLVPVKATYSLLLDAVLTHGFLGIMLAYNETTAVKDCELVKKILGGWDNVDEPAKSTLQSVIKHNEGGHVSEWLLAITGFVHSGETDKDRKAKEAMDKLKHSSGLSNSRLFDWDWRLVTKIVEQGPEERPDFFDPHPNALIKRCIRTAAGSFHAQPFDSTLPAECKKPEGLDGFIDAVHLKHIKDTQRKFAAKLLE